MSLIDDLRGKNVFVRTVTNYFTGRLADTDADFLALDDAAWIADTGRFSQAMTKGALDEIEPYPGRCYVARGGIIDVTGWAHDLPRKTK